ncbi:MAG: 3'-5' exonuclease [Idiomarina sp.]|nr:3'-5' exonuclease [Idiomarina sp.]
MVEVWRRWRRGRAPWPGVRWVAIDCETNGLNPEDALLSLAYVPIEPPFIDLCRAGYDVIQSAQPLSQSAVVHQLMPATLAQGRRAKEVLTDFIEATAGSIVVAHHVAFDRAVLQAACQREGLTLRVAGWYCTLTAEQKRLAQRQVNLKGDSLTLAACRARYHLPPFQGHHALRDAIACGELFLAQTYAANGKEKAQLNTVLRRGRNEARLLVR